MRRAFRCFAAPCRFSNHFLLHLLGVILHDFQDFLKILPLSDIASRFVLQILELHRTGLEEKFCEFPPTHGARDVQWRVVVEVEGVDIALGRDENSDDASVSVATSSVQRSVAVVVVDRSAATRVQQLAQRLIVAVLCCQVERREAAEVDSVDEVVFLPAELLLVGVLVEIFRENVAQDLHAPTEPVPGSFVENCVAMLQNKRIIRKLPSI